jgi:hypothetical protein
MSNVNESGGQPKRHIERYVGSLARPTSPPGWPNETRSARLIPPIFVALAKLSLLAQQKHRECRVVIQPLQDLAPNHAITLHTNKKAFLKFLPRLS